MAAKLETARTGYLFNLFPVARGGYPEPFNANIQCVESPFVDVAESAKCNGLSGTEQECARHFVYCGESCPGTANFLQYVEALSERRARGIEAIKNL